MQSRSDDQEREPRDNSNSLLRLMSENNIECHEERIKRDKITIGLYTLLKQDEQALFVPALGDRMKLAQLLNNTQHQEKDELIRSVTARLHGSSQSKGEVKEKTVGIEFQWKHRDRHTTEYRNYQNGKGPLL